MTQAELTAADCYKFSDGQVPALKLAGLVYEVCRTPAAVQLKLECQRKLCRQRLTASCGIQTARVM